MNIVRKMVRRRPTGVAFTPNERELAMPAKQTRESIEAELNASETDRVVRKLHDRAQEALELEKHLREREAELGLPSSTDQSRLWSGWRPSV